MADELETVRQKETPTAGHLVTGLKLPSAIHAAAFSTAAAVFAGICVIVGRGTLDGRYDALGLYALTLPPIDQSDIYRGLVCILQVVGMMLLCAVTGYIVYSLMNTAFRTFPYMRRCSIPQFMHRLSAWFGLLIASTTAVYVGGTEVELTRQVQGLLFKSLSSLGEPWRSFLFDLRYDEFSSYSIAFAGLLTLFAFGCWLFIRGQSHAFWRRAIVSFFACCYLVGAIAQYSYLAGAVWTVDEYPVVMFSGMTQLLGTDNVVPILLGKDEKMFALLIVFPDSPNNVHKAIIFLPRTEVKYMFVVRTIPLYTADKYDDLVALENSLQEKAH